MPVSSVVAQGLYLVKRFPSLILFLFVGGATAGLNFGLLALFMEVFKFDYLVSVSFAYMLALIFHFSANRYMTFRSNGDRLLPQVTKYLTVSLVNYFLTILIVYIIAGVLNANVYVGVAFSILVTVAFGYIASKFWIFKHRERTYG